MGVMCSSNHIERDEDDQMENWNNAKAVGSGNATVERVMLSM